MDKVRLLLVLITIGTAAGPLAGALVGHCSNLFCLFVPPEIENGPFSGLLAGNGPVEVLVRDRLGCRSM